MHNTIAHLSLIDSQPIPKWQLVAPSQYPPIYKLRFMLFSGVKYPFGCPGHAPSLPVHLQSKDWKVLDLGQAPLSKK